MRSNGLIQFVLGIIVCGVFVVIGLVLRDTVIPCDWMEKNPPERCYIWEQ